MDHVLQYVLRMMTFDIRFPIQDTAASGNTTEVAAIPSDGKMPLLQRHRFKAGTTKAKANFFKIVNLRSSILLVHFFDPPIKNRPEHHKMLRPDG